MLIVIPFCHKDYKAAANLCEWMFELDGRVNNHRCLLVGSHGLADSMTSVVEAAARKAFTTSRLVRTLIRDERGWPRSCNTMFTCAATYIHETLRCPFWWNEPDCIPLKAGWADALEQEYISAGKPFMGSIVTNPCRHLTGCAIYPHDIGFYNHVMLGTQNSMAFDCIAPELTLQHTHHTELFHHAWTESDGKTQPTFPTSSKLATIRPNAVVFHRNKDHTLIDRLREQKTLGVTASVKSPTVYTYYESVPGRNEQPLIELWAKSWSRFGWTPKILGLSDFKESAGYRAFDSKVTTFPTVNQPVYEAACFRRWKAMEGSGGGLCTDYDLINNGLMPADLDRLFKSRAITVLEDGVPSAVCGGASGFRKMCDYMKEYVLDPKKDTVNGKPHVSDMFIVQRALEAKTDWIRSMPIVVQFKNDGWEKAPLIHFPSVKCGNGDGAKVKAIKDALKL